MSRTRSKRWCFTLNNYTEEEESQVRCLVSEGSCRYIIVGREVGESGTPHLQGYLETNGKMSLSSMKKILSRCHWTKANGSAQSNRTYCTKEDRDAFEDGSPMAQGKRSDLEEIQEKLDSGVTTTEIAETHFSKWVVYRRSFEAYAARKIVPRRWKTQVHIYWGPTGTGKTRFCQDQVMDSKFWSPGDYKWFDGYSEQEIVIIDDFRGEYPLPLLLKLLDRYPMQVPVKGGFANWNPRKVYITSNVNPNLWYDSDEWSRAALKRRFTNVEYVLDPLYDDILL